MPVGLPRSLRPTEVAAKSICGRRAAPDLVVRRRRRTANSLGCQKIERTNWSVGAAAPERDSTLNCLTTENRRGQLNTTARAWHWRTKSIEKLSRYFPQFI